MAVEFHVKGSRTSEYRFLPENIEVDPKMNGRHDLPDIQWIIDSILRHGQLQPVTIRRSANKPVLVAGFSRWRAISEINKKKLADRPIELRCCYTALDEQQAFLANIEENRVRNTTTPLDDAYNCQRLLNVYGMDDKQIAEAYRESVAWVKGRLKLVELVPEAKKAFKAGRLVGTAAKAISKLSAEHQRKVLKSKQEGKITAADVRKETGQTPTAKPRGEGLSELVNLKSLATALFEEQNERIVADLHDEKGNWVAVSRVALLKLYEAIA